MPSLPEILAAHQGHAIHKWTLHLPVYDRLLPPLRERPVRVLEIGVQNGGSLEMWGVYFPAATHIIGCDINPACARLRFDNPCIAVVVGNASQAETLAEITARSASFDLIVDDGSHRSSDIIRSFVNYFPHLNHGGLYVVEDLCCSYWPPYEGGLHDGLSAISFFKRLIDVINHEHWLGSATAASHLADLHQHYQLSADADWLAEVQSVEFVNSMCIIRKQAAADCVLGPSLVRGTLASIEPDILHMRGMTVASLKQALNPPPPAPPSGHIRRLRRKLGQLRQWLAP